ncbi:conserved unknown protein [Ectocarpus siliculosus]|uniref:Alcohol dehydrogenase-like C-terminal domain-containing protein n=1 Tax=Ectocarpus siliculosus TaxID=2880 RepID=D7FVW7_ECTSI|nr:conserved unknown protein [Ectocarpus siliculosus]|eukprot:CBJ25487.1 conserved unknown protein [Ectocarpus siliculosus]
MIVWRQRCFLLLGFVSGGSSTGNQPPAFRDLAPKIYGARQHHQAPEHVVGGIRGGGTSRAQESTATAGIGVVEDSCSPGGNADLWSREAGAEPSERVLILDVDGTLYGQSSGVEQQVLRWRARAYPGGVQRHPPEVFSSVSVRGLSAGDSGDGDATGYQHRANARQIVSSHRGPVFVASNSPLPHVRRVLEGVGLGNVRFAGFLTPDTRGWLTKSSPEFYDPILQHASVKEGGTARQDIWLLDDSAVNLEVASRLGFGTLLVNGDASSGGQGAGNGALSLERALACFVGAIPHPRDWQFSDSKYLRSKNAVDRVSRSKEVWVRLEEEVLALGLGEGDTLRVADLGCGLLPLLREFRSLARACGVRRLEYCGLEKEESVAKEACEGLLGLPETTVCVIPADFTSVDLAALFPRDTASKDIANPDEITPASRPHVLVGCCLADLLAPTDLVGALERLAGGSSSGDGGCLVYLPITFAGKTRMIPSAPQEGFVPSDEAVLEAYDTCLREEQGHFTCLDTLLQTIEEHGGDVMISSPSPWRVSPSGDDDDAAADSEALLGRETGTVSSRGADLPGWVRRARARAPVLEAENADLLFRLRGGGGGGRRGRGWIGGGGGLEDRAARRRSQRSATSEGIGAALAVSWSGGGLEGAPPPAAAGSDSAGTPDPEDAADAVVRTNAFLEFVAPGKVEVRHEELDEERAVGEGQVLVEAVCSSISSGTELKVFRGDFDSDSELDTTIKGMAGESMSYPLKYGYSLVGRVSKCGGGVDPDKFLGKLVFAFSPHSARVVADADGVMLVPEGIDPEDAVYLPAVETALSLVHDVHPRVGESVAVFGQGMIGLLAVAILARTHAGVGGGSVVAVDMLPDRLRVAERLGATATVTPVDAAKSAPFDVSLEVTGNPRGLQSALDLTGYGGRVVLGSWYGGGAAQLNLGMAFHRSHLTIQTSQVSRLPAGLTDRWDKDRRFLAAWSLVRELRPSVFLTTSSPPLDGAQEAYESLGAGSELGVVFRY